MGTGHGHKSSRLLLDAVLFFLGMILLNQEEVNACQGGRTPLQKLLRYAKRKKNLQNLPSSLFQAQQMIMQHQPTKETKGLIREQDTAKRQGWIRELDKAKVQVKEASM